MANWHTLPLEVKSLVLGAFIDCVVQDEGYKCWKSFTRILVFHKFQASTMYRATMTSPRSEIATLLLTIPDLQQELLVIINKKLRAANMLEGRTNHLTLQGPNRKACILSIMRHQVVYRVPTQLNRAEDNTLRPILPHCECLDVEVVNQQIRDSGGFSEV